MNDDGVQTAFELILEEIGSVSKEIKEDVNRLNDKDDYDAVSRLIGTRKKLDSFQLKVKALQKEWVQTFDLDTRARTHYEPVTVETTTSQTLPLTMTYAKASANAQCVGQKVTILPGSFVRKQILESMPENVQQTRHEAEASGVLVPCSNPKFLEVTREVLFTSPSAAAQFVAGCSVNGLRQWQVQGKGISLKQWKKQQ
jgi:hypothetical protein